MSLHLSASLLVPLVPLLGHVELVLVVDGGVQPLVPVLGLHPGQVAQAARDRGEPEGHDPLVGPRVQLKVQGPEHAASLQRPDPVTSRSGLHWLLDTQPLVIHPDQERIRNIWC